VWRTPCRMGTLASAAPTSTSSSAARSRDSTVQVLKYRRGLVRGDEGKRHGLEILGALLGTRQQAAAYGFRIDIEQLARVLRQVPGNDFVPVDRMVGNRQHDAHAGCPGGVAADVDEGLVLRRIHFTQCQVLVEHRKAMLIQPRLTFPDATRQGQRGIDVGQGVVRRFMQQAVRRAHALQCERDLALAATWPLERFRAQRVGGAHQVQQVPAAASILPFAGVRVHEIAPQHEANVISSSKAIEL
jgi:hypothetical protein